MRTRLNDLLATGSHLAQPLLFYTSGEIATKYLSLSLYLPSSSLPSQIMYTFACTHKLFKKFLQDAYHEKQKNDAQIEKKKNCTKINLPGKSTLPESEALLCTCVAVCM